MGGAASLQAATRALAAPALIVVAWEALARAGHLPADTLPQPSQIGLAALGLLADGSLLLAAWQTLQAAVGGLVLAAIIGVLCGVVLGLTPRAARVVGPSIEAMRPVPAVALMPLALLFFGFGLSMEVAVVSFACVWPVLVITIAAVRGIEPRLLDVARVLEMSARTRLFQIILPAAMARIGIGLRLAMGIALVVAVTVEIAIDPRGLGFQLMTAQQSLRPDLMYAWLAWIGILGWGLNGVLARLGASRGAP
jgi:NitT/TauT family transport system permease protein